MPMFSWIAVNPVAYPALEVGLALTIPLAGSKAYALRSSPV